jgi:hypothetical protein
MVDNVPGLRKSKSMVEDGLEVHPGVTKWLSETPETQYWHCRAALQLAAAGQTHVTDTQDITEDGVYRCMLCTVPTKDGARGTEITRGHFTSEKHVKKIKSYLDASEEDRRVWYPHLNRNEIIGYSEFPDEVIMGKQPDPEPEVETPRGPIMSLFPGNLSEIDAEIRKLGSTHDGSVESGNPDDNNPDNLSGAIKRDKPDSRASQSPEPRRHQNASSSVLPTGGKEESGGKSGGKRGKSSKRSNSNTGGRKGGNNDWGEDNRWQGKYRNNWDDWNNHQ